MAGGANHDHPTGNGGGGDGGSNGASGKAAAAAGVREQDRFMPIANVIRIMRRVLPAHAKVADDAKEMIQECVSEYISFITSEANDRCRRDQRKTVTAEDLLWAMNKLGFDDYIQPLSLFLRRYRYLEGDHSGSLRGEPLHQLVIRHRSAHVPAADLHFFAQQQQQNNYTSEVSGYGLGMFGNGEGQSANGGNSTLSPVPPPTVASDHPYPPCK